MQERRAGGKEDRRKEGWRKGGIREMKARERRDSGKDGFVEGKEECRKGGMQERRDAEDKGCRKGGIYDLWDTGKELKPQISYPSM